MKTLTAVLALTLIPITGFSMDLSSCDTHDSQFVVANYQELKSITQSEESLKNLDFIYAECGIKKDSDEVTDAIWHLFKTPQEQRSKAWQKSVQGRHVNAQDLYVCEIVFGKTSSQCKQAQDHFIKNIKYQ